MENEVKNLVAALCKFQAELQNPKKDTANPFFKSKYTDLAGVWDACRPGMAKHSLCLVQSPSVEGNQVIITGTLYHASGEFISSTLKATAKDGMPQSIGSAITYLRRYQMCAMLGVASEDDDGQAASKPKAQAFNVSDSQEDGEDEERKRLIYLRGKFNQDLLRCTTSKESRIVCTAFQKAHGKDIWATETTHKPGETFTSMAMQHEARIKGETRPEPFLASLEACGSIEEYRKLETEIRNTPHLQTAINYDALHEKGRQLEVPEFFEAAD